MPTPRKSLATHALNGTKPHYRVEDDVAARFDAGRPTIPVHLKGPARAEFKRAVHLLEQRQTLTEADRASLEIYATVFARWLQAKAAVGESLLVESLFVDKQGTEHVISKVNPLLAVIQNCEVRLLALVKELGLSPSSREHTKPTKAASDSRRVIKGSNADLFPELYGIVSDKEVTEPAPVHVMAAPLSMSEIEGEERHG